MRRRRTLRERIAARILRKQGDVFLPHDFADLGSRTQVVRALRALVREKHLVRLGYGVYARAAISPLTGQPILAAKNGFVDAARQVLDRLGVTWEPGELERAYNDGSITQVPINAVVRVKGRFARKLRYRSLELAVER